MYTKQPENEIDNWKLHRIMKRLLSPYSTGPGSVGAGRDLRDYPTESFCFTDEEAEREPGSSGDF